MKRMLVALLLFGCTKSMPPATNTETTPKPEVAGPRQLQAQDPARRRVSVGLPVAHGFDELLDNVRPRGDVRVAHAQVDDVLARPARLRQ